MATPGHTQAPLR